MPLAVCAAVAPAEGLASTEMSAVAVTAASTSTGGLGVGTLLLALVVGLLGFGLLLLLILLSDHRGRQLLAAARAVWTLELASIRERRLPESELRAETRRGLADALQDLRSVLGDDQTALELAERAAWDEHVAREDARARARAREAREVAREKAAARVARTLRQAQQQEAEARAARETVAQLEVELAELPGADAGRLAAAIEAMTARLVDAQRAATSAEERAAAEIAAAERAVVARVEAEAAILAAEQAAVQAAAQAAERSAERAAEGAAAEHAAAEQAAAEHALAERALLTAVAPSKDVAPEMTATAHPDDVSPGEVEIDVRETARLGAATGPRTPGKRGRRPASVGHSEHRRVVTSQVLESGPVVLVPVEEASGPRPPVSWQMARGAPLVGSTGTSYRRGLQVERTRRLLGELRQNDIRSIRRVARQAMAVRVAVLALAPGVVLWRTLTDAGFVVDVLDGEAGLLVALALAVVGSVLAWRVTCPPLALLESPSAKGASHLLRSLFASEQLAVRLAAGAQPSDAWRSVALRNQFPVASAVPAVTTEGALALAEQSRRTILRRRRELVRRRVAVTVVPVLVLLLPAALLLAVL